jgi:RNA polymerase sigma-70 factor (ECF subfamily)
VSPPQADPDRELILAHAPYVRGLARRLVFDAELAQDVEQEVLLAALEHAPRDPRSLKAWLAAILRHLASKAFRASERRAVREAAHEATAVPTPAEILAREDLRRALVEEVLALDAALRDVLILRYLEDLPPREVARRLSIPVETVRTRAKRGVELLRARLERKGGRERGAWCLALVAGLKLEPPSLVLATASVAAASLSGVVAMSVSKKVAVAAVVLSAAAWVTYKAAVPASPRAAPVLAAPESSALRAPPPAEAPAPAKTEDARAEIAAAPEARPAPAESTPTTGSLFITVRWFDGTPAEGVSARLHEAGTDFYAEAVTVRTGSDGTHRSAELDPGTFSLYFDRGLVQRGTIEAGVEAKVEVDIPRGFDISGRVVDPGGRAVAGADILLDQMGGGWNGYVVARSESDGRYLIRSVEEGIAWVSARAKLHAPSAQRELIGSSIAIEGVDLVVEPIGLALEGTVYGAQGQPLAGAQILVGPEDAYDVLFIEGGGRARVPAGQLVSSDERGHFEVPGVPAGTLPVQARAAGHAPWSGEAETSGQRTAQLEIRLASGVTLTGRVTDSAGKPVARAEVHSEHMANFASRYARTGADGTFALRDLPAREFEVSVEAEGLEGAKTKLAGAPGAALTWNPVLGAGRVIRGRLVLADTDFSKWYVTCQSQDWAGSPFRDDVHPSADGAFEIRGCADVLHSIEVNPPDGSFVFPAAQRKDVEPDGPDLVIEIDPRNLPSCTLRGRIVDELGAPVPGVNFTISRAGNNLSPSLTAGEDGEFEVGPYPAGRYRVGVHSDEFATYLGEPADVEVGATWDFGDIQLQRGGSIAVHLTRDPALAEARVSVSALPVGGSGSRWMPLEGDVAHSEVLPAGEYVVLLRGRDAADAVAQRTARVTVRTGEEARVELHIASGVYLKFDWMPADVTGVEIQALDVSGVVLCEDSLGRNDSIAVPRNAVLLRARDDQGRTAEVPLSLLAVQPEFPVTIELK